MNGISLPSNSKRLLNGLVVIVFMLGLLGLCPAAQVAGLQPQEKAPASIQAAEVQSQETAAASSPAKALTYQSGGHTLRFESDGWLMTNAAYVLRVSFLGANAVQPLSQGQAGEDSRQAAAPLQQVTYANLWDGISLSYDAPDGSLARSTYTLDPGADPTAIRLGYNGPVSIQADGSLKTSFEKGAISESKPIAWQEIHGQHVAVDAAFTQVGAQTVGFQVGQYDPAQRLYIDPFISWLTFVGCSGNNDSASAVDIDSSGNIFVGGASTCTWGSPRYAWPNAASQAGLVAKFNSSGVLQWHEFLGQASNFYAIQALKVDTNGEIYFAGSGSYQLANGAWPVGVSPAQTVNAGDMGFVGKLNSAGDVQWYNYLSPYSNNINTYAKLDLDPNGIYVSDNSLTSFGSPVRAHNLGGTEEVHLSKFNKSTGIRSWHTYLGDPSSGSSSGTIAADGGGNLFVSGYGNGGWSSLPAGAMTWISKLDAATGAITWVKQAIPGGQSWASSIDTDASGNILLAGDSAATWGTTPVHAFTASVANMFVAKYDSSLNLLWNTFYKGSNVTVRVYGSTPTVVGSTASSFGTPLDAIYTGNTSDNGFLAGFNGATGSLDWNTFFGGSSQNNFAHGFAQTAGGNFVVTGETYYAANWPVSPILTVGNTGNPSTNGDIFVASTQPAAAKLNALSLSAGTLSPTFAADTTSYTASVSYSNSSITVTPTVADATSTVQVRINSGAYSTVTSGSASGALSLNQGSNTIEVKVTAQSGFVQVYTLALTRRAAVTTNTLSALSLSTGTLSPSFASGTITYTASVPYTTTEISVTATPSDPTETLQVNGPGSTWQALASGTPSQAYPLSVGSGNVIYVNTSPESGPGLTYNIIVTRLSNNSNLSALSLSAGTLSPAFDPATTAYTASALYVTTSLNITATQADSNASLLRARVGTGSWQTLTSGVSGGGLALSQGDNTIEVEVTAQDGTTTKTYTITFTRNAQSSIATLSGLTLNHGTLSPIFDSAQLTYTAGASFSVSSLDITPACSDAYATIQVQNNSGGYTSATCGTLKNIPLSVGDNFIDIKVTAQDGTTVKTYSLTFNRAAISTNNDLSNLTLNTGTISPAFDPATSAYTVTLNYAFSSILVTPTLDDPLSNIQSRVNSGTYAAQASGVSKSFALNVGANPIDFMVTAEDGTLKTYTVSVTRQAASIDATLSSLSISAGTLSAPIVMNSVTERYIANVPFSSTTTDVTWACSNAYASVQVQQDSGPYIAATCSDTKSYNLAVGVNNIYIYVYPQSGSGGRVYWLYIVRAAASTNNNLSGLSLTNPTTALNTTFAAGTTNYTATVNNHFTTIDVTPTLADPLASIQSRVWGFTSYVSRTSGTSINFTLNTGIPTQIDFLVTAEDGSTKTYTVNVTRQPASSVATLTGLSLSKGSLTPSFATATTNYTSWWYYATSSLDITPICSDPYATYQVQNNAGGYANAVACGSPSSIPLIVVYNYIDIKVTAQNGATTQTYTLRFDRAAPSTDATLSGLSLTTPSTSLNPTFAAGTISYNATVNYAFSSINATPTLSNWVNSLQSRVNTGAFSAHTNNASKTFALNTGVNTIDFLVTAEDPSTPTKTYTITVTRQAASSVATLSGLTLSTGTLSPTFDSNATSYTAGVSSTTTSLNITPACSDAYATPQVQNNAGGYSSATCGSAKSIPLTIGPNVIEILVTAQDGSTSKTYTITVMRATVSALSLGAGAFSPAFTGGTTSYTLPVPWTTTSTTVTATLSAPDSTLLYFNLNGGIETALTSGTASGALALNPGANSIDVVTRDKTTSALVQTFTITVTRAAASTSNTLSALTLTVPTTSLNTTFAAGTTSYTATVNNYFTTINATPTLTDPLASIQSRVNGDGFNSQTSGASKTFALAVGANTIDFLVTAEDGSTQTYTVTVTRQPASSVATLSGLTLSDGTLSPSFASATTDYTAGALYAVTNLNITAACSDAYATLQVQNNSGGYTSATCGTAKSIPLSVGANVININVTAQDGTTTQTYTLTFTRAPASTNSNLSTLIVSAGSISPAFSASTSAYTLSLPYATATTTLTATRADATASMAFSLNGGTAAALTSGSASASQSLRTGDNTLVVTITAENGSTKTYTVTVTRAALSALSVSPGSLSPAFTSTTSSYTQTSTSDTTILTATYADSSTKLYLSLNGAAPTVLTSGTGSSVNLLAGVANTLDVQVKDNAGTTLLQTYRVTITRPAVLTAPADATYYGGQNIDFTVTYGRAVTVDITGGKPSIVLTVGDSTHPDATYQAEYFSGSGTTSLTFRWNVASAFDDNGIAAASTIVLNGGTLTDSIGDSAILSLTSVTTSGVKVIGGLTLTLATGGYGSGTLIANPLPSINSTYYMPGTVVTLTATADTSASPNSRFIGWSGDMISTTNPENITINSNMSINAWFDQVGILRIDPSYDPTSPGWGVTRFASLQNAIDASVVGDKLLVAAGTYAESISITKNITFEPAGGVTISGNLAQSAGTIAAPSGNLTLGGNLSLTGGNFNNNGGTVIFTGASPIISGTPVFNNLTMAGSGTLTTTGPITVNGLLTITSGAYNPTNDSSIHSLTIGTGGSLVLDSGDILNLSGDFINSNVFNPTQGALNVAGNFTNTSTGTFCPTGGSVDVNGTFTNSGTVCGSGGSLNLAGNFINNGIFTNTGGTVIFDGSSAQSISGSTTPTFYNVDVDKAGGTLTGTVAINVSDTLDIINGVFDPFTGSVFNIVITEIHGELALTSADTVSIASLDNKGVFSPTGGTANISGNLTNSGTISPSGGSINIAGNLENNGSFEPTGGTVSLNGSGNQAITGSNPAIFNTLTIDNAGTETITTTQAVTVRGDLIVNDGSFKPATDSDFNNILINTNGSLDFSTGTFSVSGNFTNNGTFIPGTGTGTVIFDGSGAQAIDGSSTTNFVNLTLSGTGPVTTSQAVIVSGLLTVNQGDFRPACGSTFNAVLVMPGASITPGLGCTITINSPVVSNPIPDQSAQEGVAYSFTFAANTFTTQSGTLTYSATLANNNPLPSWLHFDPATRVFSGTPAVGSSGDLEIKVSTTNGSGTTSDSFIIHIAGKGSQPPLLVYPIGDQLTKEGVAFSYSFPADTFISPSDSTLNYSASGLPAWLTFTSGTRTLSGTPPVGSASINGGIINLSIITTDASGGSASDEFTFTVYASSTNLSPVLRLRLHDQVAIAGTVFTFTTPSGFIEDPEHDSLTYSATLASGDALPAWLSFSPGSHNFSGTPAASDVGKLLIRVTANDGNGHTANDVFLLGVCSTDLQTLYLPISPAGVPAMSNVGQVIRLPAPVPADENYYLVVTLGVAVRQPPESHSTFDLMFERDIKLYDGSGNRVTILSGPINVCFMLTESQWAQYSTQKPSIGTASDLLSPWTLEDGTLYASSHEICASFSHLSLFDLFFQVTPNADKKMPNTGFAPNRITSLPVQPASLVYAKLSDLWLEIPSQNLQANIVGIPEVNGNWDVSWLGTDAGWLNGTAFPTWEGNSVLTAHVTDSNGLPGPFANLKDLKYGDQIIVHLYGDQYTFEVRNTRLAQPYSGSFAFKHLEGNSYLTLITCQGYNAISDSYFFRRIVRAVLVSVK